MTTNPMQSAHLSPRCTAKSKRSKARCKAPAVKGWNVCRMHGARGGAPEGKGNGNYVHGLKTKQAAAARRETRDLIRRVRELCGEL
jgi:hypothetical protein